MHYRSWLFLEGYYFPTGLCLPFFAVSAVHADCSSKFCKPQSSVFCLYNTQLNCTNSAQNALEVDILRSKVKKIFSGEGNAPFREPSPVGRGTPPPHTLSPRFPPFANPGSATGSDLLQMLIKVTFFSVFVQ